MRSVNRGCTNGFGVELRYAAETWTWANSEAGEGIVSVVSGDFGSARISMFPTHWSNRMSFPGGFALMVIFSPGFRRERAPPSASVVPLAGGSRVWYLFVGWVCTLRGENTTYKG